MLCLRDATVRASEIPAQHSALPLAPRLDGELLYDNAARHTAANDWGHYVHNPPVAVLRPASVTDVSRIVRYANQRRLTVAVRGQGHCVHGQAQAGSGIVIDSSRLNAIGWHGNDQLDAQPGALWGAVATTALERSLIPPVMPDALMLSIGGTLSAGGTGQTSCGSGAQVDHVLELDVVTGHGDLVTCSPARSEELFRMVLAGLGQCGLIVRARLRLVHATPYVLVRTLTCDDSDALISDHVRLATSDGPPVLVGEVTKDAGGRWRFVSLSGTFAERPEDERTPEATRMSYWDYLDRRTASVAATKARGTPNPSLAVTLPERSVRPFLAHALADPEASAGIWRIEVIPMITARFTQPLHVIPEGALAFTLRLQRRASAENAADHKAMLTSNRTLVQRCLDAGGKVYPPFAPVLSPEDWRRHYGAATWQRFAAAKDRFDPNHVLTPGVGVFA